MAGSDEQRDSAVESSAGEPGAISRLLVEIFQIPEGDLASSWREALKPGDAVGRYEIRREIGRGGFGAVYEAFDPQLGRTVALKALKPGRSKHPVSEAWIQKEAEAVARLDHPCIVTLFDVGTCNSGAYLVMELLRGKTLAQRIAEGAIPQDEALHIAEEMAKGLAHAHQRGVLHRDLKPANVFLCEDGRVKLLDFGLAHLLGTERGSSGGTPAYMAPEQAAGAAVDERADVWAAGMVLGEMLTGKRPVERTPTPSPGPAVADDGTELMWGSPPSGSPPSTVSRSKMGGLPRALGKAIAASVSDDPEARPRNGAAWLAELHSARRAIERPRRIRRVTAFATAFVLVGLAVAGFATWRIWERQIPGGRPTVAVADFANETGDSELDGISGLLITSLEQGTQLRVLTRGRMLDVLKQLGKADVQRIDETLAREVGREARANALLLASIRRMGEASVVELRALDPLHDEYVFTVSDRAPGKPAVFDLVDRLASTVRSRIGVAETAGPEPIARVASITTASPKAWDLLSRSRAALDGARRDEAIRLAEEALVEDPDFALAHYQLATMRPYSAIWRHWAEEPDPHLAAAERLAPRLPERERLVLRVLRSQATNRWEDAREASARLADAYPLDKEAQFLAGVVRSNAELKLDAIPYYRQALRLDPGYRRAVVPLVRALAATGRVDQDLPWLREQARLATSSQELWNLGIAFLTENLVEEATEIFRRKVAMAGGAWPSRPLLSHLVYSGRAAEAERAARAGLAGVPEDAAWNTMTDAAREFKTALFQALIAQGKIHEAERTQRAGGPVSRSGYVQSLRLWDLWKAAPAQDFPALEAATRALEEHEGVFHAGGGSGGVALSASLTAAMAGRFDLAGPIARRVLDGRTASDPVPEGRVLMTAIATAHEGPPAAALRALAQAADPSGTIWLLPARIIRGHYLRARGDCAGAIESYERAVHVKFDLEDERLAFLPLMLHSLALCHEKLGDLPKARERNDEMLRLWANADPDLPLLADAKALHARLAVK